jgi:hypothetical protein
MATPVVATLATAGAIDDLKTLLFSLGLFNNVAPKVYLYCDSATAAATPSFKYKGEIVTRAALDIYSGKNRLQMERTPGQVYPSMWFDFMAEKINLLEWAAAEEKAGSGNGGGIFFCDADICFFGPLPQVPSGVTLALSPHYIRPYDESRYGRYNGGYLWLSDPGHLAVWRKTCHGSRFYEQSALEDVGQAARLDGAFYEFPITENYGWWRLWQSAEGPDVAAAQWSIGRNKAPGAAGILIGGAPLGSVHTHFCEKRDRATVEYNTWVKSWLEKLAASHVPARRLLQWLNTVDSVSSRKPKIE